MTKNLTHKIKFSEIHSITSEIKERCRNHSPVWFLDKETAKRIVKSFSIYEDKFNWDNINSGYSLGQINGVEVIIHDL